MKRLKMQPTFRLELPGSSADATQKLRSAIKMPELLGQIDSAAQCFDLRIEPAEQRYWSPHLSVQLSDAESGTELFGRFSPRPEVWTLFMAIYFATTFCMIAAAIYGYVQWFFAEPPWALVILPLGMAMIGGLHTASLVGQQLSADQMQLLRSRLDRALELASISV